MAMSVTELRGALEAVLFVAGEPVKTEELAEAFPDAGVEAISSQLDAIRAGLDEAQSGLQLELAAGGWRFATRPEYDPFLRKFFAKQGEGRLSVAALETLAIIAYRQPVTAPEISDIRGVNSAGVLRTLTERKLIKIAGRKNVVGSPFLYRTTRDFLMHFGLNSIQDLPRLEEFAEILGENLSEELIEAIGGAPSGSLEDMEILDAGLPGGDGGEGDLADAAAEASGVAAGSAAETPAPEPHEIEDATPEDFPAEMPEAGASESQADEPMEAQTTEDELSTEDQTDRGY